MSLLEKDSLGSYSTKRAVHTDWTKSRADVNHMICPNIDYCVCYSCLHPSTVKSGHQKSNDTAAVLYFYCSQCQSGFRPFLNPASLSKSPQRDEMHWIIIIQTFTVAIKPCTDQSEHVSLLFPAKLPADEKGQTIHYNCHYNIPVITITILWTRKAQENMSPEQRWKLESSRERHQH